MNKKMHNYGTMSPNTEVGFEGTENEELNRLSDEVVTNIYTINSSWKTLDNALKSLGTHKDSHSHRERIHTTQLSTNKTISETSKHLQKLMAKVKNSEKQKKLQFEKLMENFKEAVAKYSSIQKHVADKMKANLLVVASIESPPADAMGQQQKQLQLSRELAFEQDMYIEREARIRQIEEDVLDVNQVMKDLSVLVHQQGETIDTIENCIDHTVGNVEEGREELIKASRYQRKFHKKLCILVIIAVVIVSVLITIIVVELKKS
ncbi:syntaxin-12 [Agrilus planipennis]|uniref:Syntaxin-12 n=1 Tax=Agrilus planipennis TaxID=224129 RepID=A0A1W4WII0_AGRPL|nr:syntaxin-12 [Agrilus planipennis]